MPGRARMLRVRKTSRTMPRALCMKHLVPCMVTMPAASWPRCCSSSKRVVDQLVDGRLGDHADDAAHGSAVLRTLRHSGLRSRSRTVRGQQAACSARSHVRASDRRRRARQAGDRAAGERDQRRPRPAAARQPRATPKTAPSSAVDRLERRGWTSRGEDRAISPQTISTPMNTMRAKRRHDSRAEPGVADGQVRRQPRRPSQGREIGDEPARPTTAVQASARAQRRRPPTAQARASSGQSIQPMTGIPRSLHSVSTHGAQTRRRSLGQRRRRPRRACRTGRRARGCGCRPASVPPACRSSGRASRPQRGWRGPLRRRQRPRPARRSACLRRGRAGLTFEQRLGALAVGGCRLRLARRRSGHGRPPCAASVGSRRVAADAAGLRRSRDVAGGRTGACGAPASLPLAGPALPRRRRARGGRGTGSAGARR